jgi:hypothetical protein
MYRTFFSDKGGHLQVYKDLDSPKLVPFPVCLAIKYGEEISAECPDFILNIDKSWIFVRTESPLPAGTPLLMHFYIPPENKLLAEAKGKVLSVDADNAGHPKGMLVKIGFFSRGEMKNLEHYLEGKKHLMDSTA